MAQHYSDRTKNRLKAEGVYNLSVQDYEVLPISTCWCNFLPTSCSTWTHSAAQKRDSWWRIGKNGLRHPQISKGSSKCTMRSWHPFRNVSEWWGSFWGRDLLYKGLMTWYDMEKNADVPFRMVHLPRKKWFPPTWGREYHSLQKNTNTKTSIWNLKLPYPPLCHWYL